MYPCPDWLGATCVSPPPQVCALTIESIGDAPVVVRCRQVIHGPPHGGAQLTVLRAGLVYVVVIVVVWAPGAPRAGRAAPVPHVPDGTGAPVQVGQTGLAVYGAPGPGSVPLLVQHEDDLLQLGVLPQHGVLVGLQLLQLHHVGAHLLPHGGGGVAAEALPLPGQLLALLPVVVQEAAELPQLVVVVLQLLVDLLQAPDLVQVHLQPPVDVFHHVAVLDHQVHFLAVDPPQSPEQLVLAAPQQLLVRQLAQILLRPLGRVFSHDGLFCESL